MSEKAMRQRTISYDFLRTDPLPADVLSLICELYGLRSRILQEEHSLEPELLRREKEARRRAAAAALAMWGGAEPVAEQVQELAQLLAPHTVMDESRSAYKQQLDAQWAFPKTEHDLYGGGSLLYRMFGAAEDGELPWRREALSLSACGGMLRFETLAPRYIRSAVEEWMRAYLFSETDTCSLLLMPCATVDLVAIWPAATKWLRTVAFINTYSLVFHGFETLLYGAPEALFLPENPEVAQALQQSLDGWHERRNDYFPYVRLYLRHNIRCAEQRLRQLSGLRVAPSNADRIGYVAEVCPHPLSKRDISVCLPEMHESTIERLLARLVKEGRLCRLGRSSRTRYINAEVPHD